MRSNFVRYLLVLISLCIAAFWVWALFFPPKQSVARLDDREWTARAESICQNANRARNELADERRIEDAGPDALSERADLIDEATRIIDRMLSEMTSSVPNGESDAALLETWIGYYRRLLEDRRAYTDVLRGGENPPFPETTIDGAPISEFINDFTVANEMKACSAPADLAV
jgi:hypothetical protein